jgi:cytochrome b561
MQIKSSAHQYGAVAQLLHWAVVVLIVWQIVLAGLAEDASSLLQKAKLLTTHKSLGMTIFMLAVLRLLWRFATGAPEPATGPRWQQRLATVTHGLLYALILLTPLMGWMMSSAKNYSVSWFGVFTWPDLVAPSESRYELLHTLHEGMARTMVILVFLHIGAALKHHFVDKDNVLRRMLPTKLKDPK